MDGTEKIKSKAAYTTGGVTVNYNEADSTDDEKVFLYVQDADSVYSVEITEDTTVALSGMTGISNLTDKNTKIWLEKSEDNVAYAVMAEEAQVKHLEAKGATCEENGQAECWYFTIGKDTYYFSDESCITSMDSHIIPAKGHKDENSDGTCDNCKESYDGIGTKLVGYNLSLNGNIAVNFFMELSDAVVADNGAYAYITYPNGNQVLTKTINVSEALMDNTTIPGKTYYVFTCEVSAKDMTGDITITMHTSDDKVGQTYTYTVKDYADYVINHDDVYSAQMVAFAKAIVNYGAYSQLYFQNNMDKPANSSLEDTDKDVSDVEATTFADYVTTVKNNTNVGKFVSAYLTLKTETTVNVLFQVAEDAGEKTLTFKVGDTTVEPAIRNVGGVDYYCISVENIKASDLNEMFEFSVSDGENTSTMRYGAFSYAYTVLSGNYSDSLKNVTRALWKLNQTAEAYIETKQQ